MIEVPQTVWVVTVDARHVGPGCIGVFRTRARANETLAEWCRQFWDSEGVEGDEPEDNDECIERYFDHVDESYDVEEVRYCDE